MTALLLWKSLLMDNANKLPTKQNIKIEERDEGANLCRVCDQEYGNIPIFNNTVHPNIPKEIYNFSGVMVELSDDLSKHICDICLDLLNGCIMFREMCQKTNKMIVETSIMKDSYLGPVDEYSDFNDFDDTDECPYSPIPNYSEGGMEKNLSESDKKLLINFALNKNKRRPNTRRRRRKDQSTRFDSCLCDVCGKSIKKSSLAQHRMIHVNIFPHKCDQCPYKGRTADLLKTHKMSHLPKDELPYKCTQCPTAMTSSSNLAKHIRGVHGRAKTINRAYKCTYCDTSFVYKYDMTRHIKVKHINAKQNTIACELCFAQFSSKHVLLDHHIKVHNMKPKLKGLGRLPSYLQAQMNDLS